MTPQGLDALVEGVLAGATNTGGADAIDKIVDEVVPPRYRGIVDTKTGKPRAIPGAVPAYTPAPVEEPPTFLDHLNPLAPHKMEQAKKYLGEARDAATRGTAGMVGAIGGLLERQAAKPPVETEMFPPEGPPPTPAEFQQKKELEWQFDSRPTEFDEKVVKVGTDLQESARLVQEEVPRPYEFWSEMKRDPVRALALGGIESLPQLGTVIAASAVSPAAGIGTAMALETGNAYVEAKEYGATEEQAQLASGIYGTASALLEYFPAGKFLRGLKGGSEEAAKGVMRRLVEQAFTESGTEQIQGITSMVTNAVVLADKYDLTMDEFLRRVGEDGLTAFVVGGAVGGASVATTTTRDAIPEGAFQYEEDEAVEPLRVPKRDPSPRLVSVPPSPELVAQFPDAIIDSKEYNADIPLPDADEPVPLNPENPYAFVDAIVDEIVPANQQTEEVNLEEAQAQEAQEADAPEERVPLLDEVAAIAPPLAMSSPTVAVSPILGTAPSPSPVDWTAAPPATKRGSKLVSRFEKDKIGSDAGERTITDYLSDLTGAQLRVGREQLTSRREAQYEPTPHLVRAKTGNSIVSGAHEMGHALSAILREDAPDLFADVKPSGPGARTGVTSLASVASLPGSFASGVNPEEGMAEWVRRYITEPQNAAQWPVTARLEAEINKVNPEIIPGLQDAARAYQKHKARPVWAQLRSKSKARKAKPPAGDRVRNTVDRILFTIASRRRGLHRWENEIWRGIKQYSKERQEAVREANWFKRQIRVRQAKKNANVKARQYMSSIKDTPADFERAYQMTLEIMPETNRAIAGPDEKGATPGLRYIDLSIGDWVYVTDFSVQDVVDKIPETEWPIFETYGQTRAALARAEQGHKILGPGPDLTIDDMKAEVARLETENPVYKEAFEMVRKHFDGLLDLTVATGLKTAEEASLMKAKYGDYWALLRDIEREEKFFGSPSEDFGDPGMRRAYGGGDPYLPVIEALRRRTYSVLSAAYWNDAVLAPVRAAERMRADPDMPLMAKAVAERVAVRLFPEREAMKRVASLAPHEQQRMIADNANLRAMKEATGKDVTYEELRDLGAEGFEELTGSPFTRPDDVEIFDNPADIFRRQSPRDTAVNVVVTRENGEPSYFQIEDPIYYDMFAKTNDPAKLIRWYGEVMNPMVAPWKEALTTNPVFTAFNISRDIAGSMELNTGARSFVPAYYFMKGLAGRLTGKSPKDRAGAELLSKVADHINNPRHRSRYSSFLEELQRGVYYEGWSQLDGWSKARSAPGILMSAGLKPINLLLWASGSRKLAETAEMVTREGAYRAVKESGGSDAAAQAALRLVSGNFGETPGDPNMAILYESAGFLNPTMQHTYEAWRNLSHPDPKIRGLAIAKIGWIGTLSMMGWAVNQLLMSEERKEELKERDEEDRLGYMPIAGWVRVPFSPGNAGILQSFAWNWLDEQFGGSPEMSNMAARTIMRRISDMPGQPMAVVPPVAKTWVEVKSNYVFYFDKPIVPYSMSALAPAEQKFDSTPGLYVWLGEQTNFSPLKIQHIVGSSFNRLYSDILRGADMVKRGEPIKEPADVPFFGRVFIKTPKGYSSRAVLNLDQADRKMNKLRKEAKAILNDGKPLPSEIERQINAADVLRRAVGDIRDMSVQSRELRSSGKHKEAEQLQKDMTQLAAEALAEAERIIEGE